MKRKIKYTEEPMGKLMVVKDFLPPPDQLVLKEENVKVTISLNKSSVEFFKKEAQKHRTSYQRMIRRVIDWYACTVSKGYLTPNGSFQPSEYFSGGSGVTP